MMFAGVIGNKTQQPGRAAQFKMYEHNKGFEVKNDVLFPAGRYPEWFFHSSMSVIHPDEERPDFYPITIGRL
jgi:hypothetical protein